MKESYFYYYGCIVPLSEVTGLMIQFNKHDMYSFVFENGLQYRRVGEVAKTFRIIVGKELKIFTDENPYDLSKDCLYKEMYETDIKDVKLSSSEKNKINLALVKVGCYSIPKYYATYNYLPDEINI